MGPYGGLSFSAHAFWQATGKLHAYRTEAMFSSNNTEDQATAFLINKESTIYFEGVVSLGEFIT